MVTRGAWGCQHGKGGNNCQHIQIQVGKGTWDGSGDKYISRTPCGHQWETQDGVGDLIWSLEQSLASPGSPWACRPASGKSNWSWRQMGLSRELYEPLNHPSTQAPSTADIMVVFTHKNGKLFFTSGFWRHSGGYWVKFPPQIAETKSRSGMMGH